VLGVLAAGCGCAPNAAVQWLVVAALLVGGAAIVVAGPQRPRRGRDQRGSARPDAGAPPTPRALNRSTVAGVLLGALATVVAVVAPGADVSLLALAGGVVIASVGVAPARRRRERGARVS
jgi:hypothetical protein